MINTGRHASSEEAIPAPDTPKAKSSNGSQQHADAISADTIEPKLDRIAPRWLCIGCELFLVDWLIEQLLFCDLDSFGNAAQTAVSRRVFGRATAAWILHLFTNRC